MINEPRSITKNDAQIHCNITNIMTFNDLNPYLEKNIKKVYPDNFPVQIEKIGTNYLPLVVESLKIFCHPYINWIDNYKYLLVLIPSVFIFLNFKNKTLVIILVLTAFNGLYQSLRSGNISLIAQLFFLLFLICVFHRKIVICALLFALVVYIKITIFPVYLLLFFALKNKDVKKFLKFSLVFLLSLIILTYLIDGENMRTWINYYNFLSNSENINSFNVVNDTFGNYYDTPSVPNLLHYFLQSNLVLFLVFSIVILIFTTNSLYNFQKTNMSFQTIIMDSLILYFLLNPYIRTYHLIEVSIFLCFYLKDRMNKLNYLIIFFSIIPQLTLLEVGTQVLAESSVMFISLYPPMVFTVFIFIDKLKNKSKKFLHHKVR